MRIDMTRYRFLPRNHHTYLSDQWAHCDLRKFNMAYCQSIRGMMKRPFNRAFLTGENKFRATPFMEGMDFYFLVWNLEVLGKPKLAEAMYYYMIKNHIFKMEI